MAVITDLSPKQIRGIFANYNLGEVCSFSPASNGIENTNYYVSTSTLTKRARKKIHSPKTRDFLLTLIERDLPVNPLLQPILLCCEKAGLPVANLLANNQDKFEGAFGNKPFVISPKLRGHHVFNPTKVQCEAIGRFLARFHLACHTYRFTQTANANTNNLIQATKDIEKNISHADATLIRETIKSIRSMLVRNDVKNLPQGIIHGDLFRDNVLFNERGLSGVLEFHHAKRSYWLFDLCVAVNDWCSDGSGMLDTDKTLKLVSAYNSIRPLVREEFWFFPVFSLYAAITFWLSRLTTILSSGDLRCQPTKNPGEFRKIVTQHTSHPFYLDSRLLGHY
ncbi:MAG: homoserine kinase [Pseudomonadales bacterium]|nr:homoserine kinase [Pseudomonadales bacterium]